MDPPGEIPGGGGNEVELLVAPFEGRDWGEGAEDSPGFDGVLMAF